MEQERTNATKENIAVYETLRNSIINCENRISNEIVSMYVVYFALLAFGFDHSWMILVSYLVLIAFQAQINGDSLAIEKASTYIRVFFEQGSDIHWESLHKDRYHIAVYKAAARDISWYIKKYGSSMLALVSFLVLLITSLQQYGFCALPPELVIELLLAIFLCVVVILINLRSYINNGDTGGAIEESIRRFYEKCYEQPGSGPADPAEQNEDG